MKVLTVSPGGNKRIRQVAGIDGLRGLAVLAVVFYHFFKQVVPGGFLGVDVFFVISGFLITSLLIREVVATGSISLGKFWQRRARRILPAAVFVLVVFTGVAGILGGDPAVAVNTQFLGTLFFVNNWTQIAGSQSYFADSGIQIFAHYWSLAVEEQFYLLWPLIVVAGFWIGKRHGHLLLAALSVLLGAGSVALMVNLYDPDADPTRVYYGTDTHAFGLLAGALLAFTITSRKTHAEDSFPAPRWMDYVAAGLGIPALAFLLFLMATLPDTAAETYRGGLVAASVCTAVVLWSVVRETGPVNWIFHIRALRWCGHRSFSLYLWHWPLLITVRELLVRGDVLKGNHFAPGIIAAILSFPLAAWSYAHVENPIRRHGYRGVLGAWLRQFLAAESYAPLLRQTGAAVAMAIAVVAMATAPQKSSLESDLDKLATEYSAQENAPAAAAAPIPPAETRTMPTGDQITAIGDSVMLASIQSLSSGFPGIYVDAAVSRHYTAAIPLLQGMSAQGTLDPFVFLGFGTNGPAFDGQIDEMMQIIGPDRIVVMVLPFGDREWMPQARQQVFDAASRYPNVYIADWCHVAQGNPALLRGDLIHPTLEGASAYSDAMRAALQRWQNFDRTVPQQCGG
ncbi:acyltransferase family protein [Staphylococcus chromogenes]|nr:acyltransferase family protein [Staphylococcus chromogenes]